MKKIIFTFLSICLLAFSGRAQYVISTLIGTSLNSYTCDGLFEFNLATEGSVIDNTLDYNLYTSGTNFSTGPIVLIVDWGDGTSTTFNGTSTGVGQLVQFVQNLEHQYTAGGNYNVTMVVSNPQNGSGGTYLATYNYVCNTQFYCFMTNNCDGSNIIDFPLTFTGQTIGDTFTLNFNNSMAFSNLIFPTDVYNVSIPQWWLTLNGYNVSLSPNGMTMYPGGAFTYSGVITCDATTNTFNNCLQGNVFCDNDQNGFYSSGDTYMPFAQVLVYSQGQSYTVIADANGFYSISYATTSSNGYSYAYVDPQWLAANGFQGNYSYYTFQDSLCVNQATNVNLPMNCDSTNMNTTECATGWVFCDENGNGVLDANESGLANAPVTIYGISGNSVTVYTDANGVYNYSSNTYLLGTYTYYAVLDTAWLTQNGYILTYAFSNQTFSTDCSNHPTTYFAVDCNPQTPCADLWSSIDPWIGYYQNYTNTVKLKWGNNGPGAAQAYDLTLTYPVGVTPVLSSIANSNYVISGNTITWSFVSSSTYINSIDYIQFTVPTGISSGTPHIYSTSIVPTGNNIDCCTSNNFDNLTMIVGNSYDPNDKTVNNPAIIDPTVDDELTYRIRFQNTGSAPAQDIYILDTLSSNLDLSTFELLDATHYIQVINLGNGIMKFNFPNIWLPDSTTNLAASQGSLTYRIRENAGNGIGTFIENTGHIYFDQNPAIVTNTTYNENNVLAVSKTELNNITIYPNPTDEVLNFDSDELIISVAVYDLTGKLILSQEANDIQKINTGDLTSGVYMVLIRTNSKSATVRIVKK